MSRDLCILLLIVLAGPLAYFGLDALQPSKLLVFAVVFGVPLAMIAARGVIAFFKLLMP